MKLSKGRQIENANSKQKDKETAKTFIRRMVTAVDRAFPDMPWPARQNYLKVKIIRGLQEDKYQDIRYTLLGFTTIPQVRDAVMSYEFSRGTWPKDGVTFNPSHPAVPSLRWYQFHITRKETCTMTNTSFKFRVTP